MIAAKVPAILSGLILADSLLVVTTNLINAAAGQHPGRGWPVLSRIEMPVCC